MGKFKLSHGKESKSIKIFPSIIDADDNFEQIAQRVMEKHKATFDALTKTEIIEKHEVIRIPAKSDNWARKHSIESRKKAQDDLNSHKELINKWMQAQSSQLKAIDEECDKMQLQSDIIFGNIDARIIDLENKKPEEKQIVREITMKSEIPKSIWIGMGILFIMNILTIFLK